MEHFPRNTVSASHWCGKCQKQTQHRTRTRIHDKAGSEI
jgi:hypothetical protein